MKTLISLLVMFSLFNKITAQKKMGVTGKIITEKKEGLLQIKAVAINDNDNTFDYPAEVKLSIPQHNLPDYLKAADFINNSGAEICVVQHEFGIFGGDDGVYILPFIYRLKIPIYITLHTVLKEPSSNQKAIIEKLGEAAEKIVVMSQKATGFLIDIYKIPKQKIVLIEHGVPDIHFNPEEVKKELKLLNKKVILTFGLLGRSKGIEVVLKALPKVVEAYPETLYIVLGKTHPHVVRDSGEEYRDYLTSLINDLKLENHVLFVDKFIDQQNLFKYLYACDIYISPYLNEAQITSGTLSYAVGVGAAVISTPYWHATELLANGIGRLLNFKDSSGLASVILELFNNPEEFQRLREKAKAYGEKITWPKTGEKYHQLFDSISKTGKTKIQSGKRFRIPKDMPEFSLEHIERLTDKTGIIQHAKFGIPYFREGYCLDDNARALTMVLMAYRKRKDKKLLELATIYLSYMLYMQNIDGSFRNFLTYNRDYLDKVGSEDAFGRSIWSLGYLINHSPTDLFHQTGNIIFHAASSHFDTLNSLRGIANTMIGIAYYLRNNPEDQRMKGRFAQLTEKLAGHYGSNKTQHWRWFESLLAYDNAILPLALLHATEILHEDKISHIAFESMNFLTELTFSEGYLSIIGNEKWYVKNHERSIFAQQPLDAMSMVLMYQQAYQLTAEKKYLQKMNISFLWFMGENDLRMDLYDDETKGCCDGFESYGVNRNQGAESTLAYLISYLSVMEVVDPID